MDEEATLASRSNGRKKSGNNRLQSEKGKQRKNANGESRTSNNINSNGIEDVDLNLNRAV